MADNANIISVPITKAGKKVFIDVNIDDPAEGGDIPVAVLKEVYLQGLKVLLNRGMSKITLKGLEGEQLAKANEAALTVAKQNLEKVRKGEIKVTGGAKTTKASGEVMTEARKIAKAMIKQGMKAKGIKVSHVEPKEITARANELLADAEVGPEIVKQAEESIKERKAKESAISAKLEALAAKVPISIERKTKVEAKAAKEKAEKKTQLSAKQAGKVTVRAKAKGGEQQATAH